MGVIPPRFVWHCAAEKFENLSVYGRVRFRFVRMRFQQRNSAWIETDSARSVADVSSLVVLGGQRWGGCSSNMAEWPTIARPTQTEDWVRYGLPIVALQYMWPLCISHGSHGHASKLCALFHLHAPFFYSTISGCVWGDWHLALIARGNACEPNIFRDLLYLTLSFDIQSHKGLFRPLVRRNQMINATLL